jgi:hypothetical protein
LTFIFFKMVKTTNHIYIQYETLIYVYTKWVYNGVYIYIIGKMMMNRWILKWVHPIDILLDL